MPLPTLNFKGLFIFNNVKGGKRHSVLALTYQPPFFSLTAPSPQVRLSFSTCVAAWYKESAVGAGAVAQKEEE